MDGSFERTFGHFFGSKPLVNGSLNELDSLGHQLYKLGATLGHRRFHLAFAQNAVHGIATHL
jgi:hypothetical protein